MIKHSQNYPNLGKLALIMSIIFSGIIIDISNYQTFYKSVVVTVQ